jgi:hypothetical protein
VRYPLRLLPLTCLPLAAATDLLAQDAPDRARLDTLWRVLADVVRPAEVAPIKSAWKETTSGALERAGIAFTDLRRTELTDSTAPALQAWEQFDQLVRTHPSWPYARLGLAMAALTVYRSGSPMPADYDASVGGTHYDGYVIQLKRILSQEPGFEPAVDWLAQVLADEADREQPTAAIQLLERMADSIGASKPVIQLVLARSARTRGRYRGSLGRLDAYLRLGGDAGIGALERARTLAARERLGEGAQAYMEGTAALSDAARAEYRADLSWIAKPGELARFDSLPAAALPAYFNTFWHKRDAQELRPQGARLEEHLRRWVFVHRHFRVPDPQRRTAYARVFIGNIRGSTRATACQVDGDDSLDDLAYVEPSRAGHYRARERVLDHRAIAYMRHGEPYYAFGGFQSREFRNTPAGNVSDAFSVEAPIAVTSGERTEQLSAADNVLGTDQLPESPDALSATWVYYLEGVPRVLNFYPNGALGSDAPSTMVLNYPPNLDALLKLQSVIPEYGKLAGMLQFYLMGEARGIERPIPVNCQRVVRESIREQREGAQVAVRTDTYLRRMATQLDASLQLYAMGQPENGTGQLVVAAAVSAEQLKADWGDEAQDRYLLRIGAAVIDPLNGESTRLDTTIVYAIDRTVPRKGWMAGLLLVPLHPGQKEVRVAVLQGGDERGAILAGKVEPAPAGTLAISDVILGREGARLRWTRRGQSVPVSPSPVYREGDGLDLYYELYGMKAGTEYRTQVSLRQATRDKSSSTLSFSDVVGAETAGFSRRLVLRDLKQGPYILRVTVEERGTGRRTSRERPIVIDRP